MRIKMLQITTDVPTYVSDSANSFLMSVCFMIYISPILEIYELYLIIITQNLGDYKGIPKKSQGIGRNFGSEIEIQVTNDK